MHRNNCKNNCEYAKEGILLSTAGSQKDWLYRCSKLNDRLITSDTVLLEVGCATYLFNPAKSLNVTMELVARQLDEIAKMIPDAEPDPEPDHEPEPVVTDTPVVVKPELKYEPISEKVMEVSPSANPVEKSVEPPVEKPVEIPIAPPKRRGRKPKTAEVSPEQKPDVPVNVPVMAEPVTGDELKGV